jgi:hypothetical protein
MCLCAKKLRILETSHMSIRAIRSRLTCMFCRFLQVMIHIIDLQNPSKTEKRPITADAAIMNPVAKIRKSLCDLFFLFFQVPTLLQHWILLPCTQKVRLLTKSTP